MLTHRVLYYVNCTRLSTLFKLFASIKCYKKKICDVLIYDGVGSDILLNAVPEQSSFFIFWSRSEIPIFISVDFFYSILTGFIKNKKIKDSIILAIVKELKPKVIVTYIDNSIAINRIRLLFPHIPLVTVQNGVRWEFSIKNRAIQHYDNYFSFGAVESKIFLQGGHSATNMYPIGSLRAGVFREQKSEKKIKEFDLCFISQFNPVLDSHNALDEWTANVFKFYYEAGKKYFNVVAKYAKKNNISLCVAMRNSQGSLSYVEESNYFAFHDYDDVTLIQQEKFSSYEAVQKSRLSFTISSTLGYEALGWGERVIFAKDIELVRPLIENGVWSKNLMTDGLPELQKLVTLSYSELDFKATSLLEMSNSEYHDYSKSARQYYMNNDAVETPQKILKRKIAEFIKIKGSNEFH